MMIDVRGSHGSEIWLAHMCMRCIWSRQYQDIGCLIFEKHRTGIDLKSDAGNVDLFHEIDRLGCGRNKSARVEVAVDTPFATITVSMSAKAAPSTPNSRSVTPRSSGESRTIKMTEMENRGCAKFNSMFVRGGNTEDRKRCRFLHRVSRLLVPLRPIARSVSVAHHRIRCDVERPLSRK